MSAPDFIALSKQGEGAFGLSLPDGTTFMSEQVVRRVPNSRIVCKGLWSGHAVYSKIFIGKHATRHAQRDSGGVQNLRSNNINTPAILAQYKLSEDLWVLVFEEIVASVNAEDALAQMASQTDNTQRLALLHKLIAEVARHHQAGLMQTDLYFKNFLVKDHVIYTLDGDGIRSLPRLFQARAEQHNLATLLSKMDVLDDAHMEALYQTYCQTAQQSFSHSVLAKVWQLTQRLRYQAASRYAFKKVFRTCTDVKVNSDFRHFVAFSSNFATDADKLKHLDMLMGAAEGAVRIKDGRTCTVVQVHMAEHPVVIKRYNIKGWLHALGRALRPSRAASSWAYAHYLRMMGIATPQPLALVEERLGFLRGRAYYVSAWVDAPDVVEFFKQEQDPKVRWDVACKLATMFYKLSLLNIVHGDCKASNIKVWQGQPLLLDLDAMQVHPLLFVRQHVRDLKRLMQNWKADAETTALISKAFIVIYDETDPLSPSLLARAGIEADFSE